MPICVDHAVGARGAKCHFEWRWMRVQMRRKSHGRSIWKLCVYLAIAWQAMLPTCIADISTLTEDRWLDEGTSAWSERSSLLQAAGWSIEDADKGAIVRDSCSQTVHIISAGRAPGPLVSSIISHSPPNFREHSLVVILHDGDLEAWLRLVDTWPSWIHFVGPEEQLAVSHLFAFGEANSVPAHLKRNIGYLVAIALSPCWIFDLDDNLEPGPGFWRLSDPVEREQELQLSLVARHRAASHPDAHQMPCVNNTLQWINPLMLMGASARCPLPGSPAECAEEQSSWELQLELRASLRASQRFLQHHHALPPSSVALVQCLVDGALVGGDGEAVAFDGALRLLELPTEDGVFAPLASPSLFHPAAFPFLFLPPVPRAAELSGPLVRALVAGALLGALGRRVAFAAHGFQLPAEGHHSAEGSEGDAGEVARALGELGRAWAEEGEEEARAGVEAVRRARELGAVEAGGEAEARGWWKALERLGWARRRVGGGGRGRGGGSVVDRWVRERRRGGSAAQLVGGVHAVVHVNHRRAEVVAGWKAVWEPLFASVEFAIPALQPCRLPAEPRLRCAAPQPHPDLLKRQVGGWVAYESLLASTQGAGNRPAWAAAEATQVLWLHDDAVPALHALLAHTRARRPALAAAPGNWTALGRAGWDSNPRMPWWGTENGRDALLSLWADPEFAPFRPLFGAASAAEARVGHAFSDYFVLALDHPLYPVLRQGLRLAARHRVFLEFAVGTLLHLLAPHSAQLLQGRSNDPALVASACLPALAAAAVLPPSPSPLQRRRAVAEVERAIQEAGGRVMVPSRSEASRYEGVAISACHPVKPSSQLGLLAMLVLRDAQLQTLLANPNPHPELEPQAEAEHDPAARLAAWRRRQRGADADAEL